MADNASVPASAPTAVVQPFATVGTFAAVGMNHVIVAKADVHHLKADGNIGNYIGALFRNEHFLVDRFSPRGNWAVGVARAQLATAAGVLESVCPSDEKASLWP